MLRGRSRPWRWPSGRRSEPERGGAGVRTLIENGTVVTASETLKADVLVEDQRVAAIALDLDVESDSRIDATDRFVIPGGVDVHTHFDLPFGGSFCSDDFGSGTRAAAFGGTTTCVDFALQDYGESLRQGLDRWFEKGQKAQTDFGLHMIVREVNDQVLKEMDELVNEGITSFKLFMAYPGVFMLDDASIFKAMQRAADSGALILMHAENGGPIDVLVQQHLAEGKTDPVYHGLTRPSAMEGEAVHRVFKMAELAGAPAYIVHLSSRDALEAVQEARDRGVAAFAETCPQYLYLSSDDLARPGFEGAKFVCSPPLRTKDHQDDLWKGLAQGDLQIVATDHAPFNYKGQKDLGKGNFANIPNGLPSVEDRVTLIFQRVRSGQLSPNRWVELIATNPAKMFGLYPRKGTIAPGFDADIVVFDPNRERVISSESHHMNVDYSCYEGMTVWGVPEVVMQRGNVLVDKGQWFGKEGQGSFVPRSRFQEL
jgi:dihydropyrimidinase